MSALLAILAGSGGPERLDIAALEIARIEFPGLEPEPFLALLDSHARELAELAPAHTSGGEWVAETNRYLFDSLGFTGNRDDYYDPLNSCLNEVLVRRTGIPITLALVYLELARRLARPVHGIALPGHFIVRYEGPDHDAFIDCFHGRELSIEECRQIALDTARVDIFAVPSALRPATQREIAVRMLNNLRALYTRRGDHQKAVSVAGLLRIAAPSATPH